jgi:hypothetical protein
MSTTPSPRYLLGPPVFCGLPAKKKPTQQIGVGGHDGSRGNRSRSKGMRTEELALFNAADWPVIQTDLICYAEMKTFGKAKRSVSALPEGHEPADIALLAIQKTFEWISTGVEGVGSRRWNRTQNPDLLDHLKDAVDSEVSNLIGKKEHRSTNYSSKVDGETAARILEESVDRASTKSITPEDGLLAHAEAPSDDEIADAIFAELYALLQVKKDEEALLVLMSFEEQAKLEGIPKHHVVATETGMKIEAVRKAVKRIRTAALSARENVLGRLGHGQ